jgi:hypothetical protein
LRSALTAAPMAAAELSLDGGRGQQAEGQNGD